MKHLTEKQKGTIFFVLVLIGFIVLSVLVVATADSNVVSPDATHEFYFSPTW